MDEISLSLLLATSGLVQLLFGVLLGWPMALFHTGLTQVGPLKHPRRVLQCHIDNLMMGIIQIGLATVASAAPPFAVVLIMAGSWVNAQLFLIQACLRDGNAVPGWGKGLSISSFLAVSAGYLVFVPMVLIDMWN